MIQEKIQLGEWNTVEKDMLKIGQEFLRELSMRTPK